MLAWFYRKAKKKVICRNPNCKKTIHKRQAYIGRNTYGGIMAYCVGCCPVERYNEKVRDIISIEKTIHSIRKEG